MTDQLQLLLLSNLEVAERMVSVPEWALGEGVISRELEFSGFIESMAFVNRLAALAEEHDHHPDIHISYNRVRLDLTTHKVGGLSEKDFALAEAVDGLI